MKGHSFRRALVSCVLLAAVLIPQSSAQQQPQQTPAKKFELTVDSIMRGPDLVGYQPTGVYWSQDSRRIYFRWKRAGEPRLKEPSLYVVGSDGTGLRKLSENEARQAPPAAGELSKDKTLTVFTEDGDVFLYDHAKGERRQLTRTVDAESNAHFTRDQRHVYFTRQSNLYVLALDGGSLEQLTDIRTGAGGGEATPPRGAGAQGAGGARGGTGGGGGGGGAGESQEFVRKEERQLIEAVRERAEQREEQERDRRARDKRRPFMLPPGQAVVSLQLSPDGSSVVAAVSEQSAGKNTIVPNFVTESGYTEEIQGRTKVGDLQGRTRLCLISVATGEVKWIETGLQRAEVAPRVQTRTEQNSTVEAQRERGVENQAQQTGGQTQGQQAPPRAQGQQTEATASAPRDRDVQLFQLQWSEDGTRAALLARAADNKDRWVMSLDPSTAKTKVLARIHDDAWVGGPGSFTLGWLPDNRRVFFVSERDGWAHLYTVNTVGGDPVQLTRGQFEVSDVRLSADKTKFYFTSSEGSLFERHLYSMSTEGGTRTRLTTLHGNNQADVSPDETELAVVNSYSNKPPELYLQPNRPAAPQTSTNAPQASNSQTAEVKQVTTSPVPEFFTYEWIDPPIVSFRARDGATVYGRLYKPANFRRGGPAVIFVHGAGYLQDVTKWWSSYYREYMFQHLLMERGFTVLSIDYRGSAGYGRDWRTGIYRHMGGKDLDDHVDAVRYLVGEHGVDPRRVGIYGGSYGGFITLMAMFTTPDIFAAGAALRPVTDWAHYNHPYTSNILNDPQDDPEAYRQSSPIYFAGGLKGALLICHGMVDTNVNFQDSVRLVERLIELRKENWQVAPYPVEDHSFERADSWADEYKRILKLFTEQLQPDSRPPTAWSNVTSEAAPQKQRGKSRKQ
ncbi:MAG TPA: alpha/beta fold hydrolase [Pyrinomonadaceae bacterium]|jgi:dipeptidyl aminopeptidase/acylaminoacyl peptidase|nr:alpha/beta fold hydrolase [Pyrinomonadaceae bacterium]